MFLIRIHIFFESKNILYNNKKFINTYIFKYKFYKIYNLTNLLYV